MSSKLVYNFVRLFNQNFILFIFKPPILPPPIIAPPIISIPNIAVPAITVPTVHVNYPVQPRIVPVPTWNTGIVNPPPPSNHNHSHHPPCNSNVYPGDKFRNPYM